MTEMNGASSETTVGWGQAAPVKSEVRPASEVSREVEERRAMSPGLAGVVLCETRTSEVDGRRGRLTIAGLDVADFAKGDFEEACVRLFGVVTGAAATSTLIERVQAFRNDLGQARADAYEQLSVRGLPPVGEPMPWLQWALLSAPRPPGSTYPKEAWILGVLSVAVARIGAQQLSRSPFPPSAARGHAADFLFMLHGEEPAREQVSAMNAYFCTVMDHGLNASTLAARVAASTEADLVSCVIAGISALKGRLHGGAPGPVLDMLDAIEEPSAAADYLRGCLERGERIMGMGHRVYRVRDPRASVLSERASELSSRRLTLARAVEETAEQLLRKKYPQRDLRANVEFYTAVLLEALGVPRQLFTPVFAMSRAAGWCAHVIEQRAEGRIIRPSSVYVGERAVGSAP